MASSIADLSIDVSTNTAAVEVGFRKLTDTVNQNARQMESAVNGIGGAMGTLTAGLKGLAAGVSLVAITHQMIEFGKETVAAAEELNNLSAATGSSVESLSKLSNQAYVAGTSFQEMQGFLFKMNKSLAEAPGSTTDAARALEFLGVTAKDPAAALQQVIDAMARYEGGIGKAALATAIFGKSGQEFLATLDNMSKLGDVNATVTAQQAEESEKLEIALRKMSVEATTFKNIVLSAVVPALNEMIDRFRAAREGGIGFFSSLAASFASQQQLAQTIGLNRDRIAELREQINLLNATKQDDTRRAWLPGLQRELADATQRLEAFTKARDAAIFANVSKLGFTGDARDLQLAQLNRPPPADFSLRDKQTTSIDKVAQALDALEKQLQRELAAEEHLTEVDKIWLALQDGSINAIGAVNKKRVDGLLAMAAQVDKMREEIALQKGYLQGMSDIAEALKQENELRVKRGEAANKEFDAFFEGEEKKRQALEDSIRSMRESVEQQEFEVTLIGKSNTERARAIFLRDAERAGIDQTTASFQQMIDRMTAAVGARDALQENFRALQDIFRDLADAGARFITDFVEHGSSSFRKLWDDFKHWALTAIAQVEAKRIILNLTAGTSLAGAATNALANSGGPLDALLGGSSFLGLAGSASLGAGFTAGMATLGIAADAGVAAVGGLSVALGALGAVAIPVVGVVLAAAAAFGLFGDNKPSQVRGRFRISSGTGGFEDNAFTPSAAGNLGFSDADTQYFGGQAAQVFNKIVAGAIDAFDSRFSAAQSDRLATVLQSTTFPSFEGTFTTEDFIKQYGGPVLKQVIVSAFDILDPALGSVAAKFNGTADEIATFGNTLLGVYDASKDFSDQFRATIVDALGDATQETATKVLSFVQIMHTFGDAIVGLGAQFEQVSAENIPKVIDALGGPQAAGAALGFVGENFLTNADKIAQANERLNSTFASLNLTVPQTHQQFLEVLSSLDLNTEAGRRAYATLLGCADAFVLVHGTAEEAASGLNGLAASAQKVADATDYFNQHFYSDSERAQRASLAGWTAVHNAWTQFGGQLMSMGYDHIPTTTAGFRHMVEGIDRTTEAGEALYEGLIVLAPGIDDINAAAAGAGQTISDAAESITNSMVSLRDQIDAGVANTLTLGDALADMLGGTTADKLITKMGLIKAQIADLQTILAQDLYSTGDPIHDAKINETIAALQGQFDAIGSQLDYFSQLSNQYGSAIAEQLYALKQQYDAQIRVLPGGGTGAVLEQVNAAFTKRWDDIVNGTADGVSKTQDQLERLRKSIRDHVADLLIGDLSPASPNERLAQAQAQYAITLASARAGNTDALGNISGIGDALIRLEREVHASGADTTSTFNKVIADLTELGNATTADPNQTVANAMPTGSPVASQADIRALQGVMQQVYEVMGLTAEEQASLLRNVAQTNTVIADNTEPKSNYTVIAAPR